MSHCVINDPPLPCLPPLAILFFMLRLVLASASPRRRALVQLLGLPVTLYAVEVDERQVDHPTPAHNAVETAYLKAQAAAQRWTFTEETVVVGADTNVALDGHILGKPADAADATRMLRRLCGRLHQVHTGLALIHWPSQRVVMDVASVDVPMRAYSDAEIAAYVATGDPLDKAGAYAIQHPVFRPVADLSGCYAGVVGLPLCHLTRALRQLGVFLSDEVAARCQTEHRYDCPVWRAILRPPI